MWDKITCESDNQMTHPTWYGHILGPVLVFHCTLPPSMANSSQSQYCQLLVLQWFLILQFHHKPRILWFFLAKHHLWTSRYSSMVSWNLCTLFLNPYVRFNLKLFLPKVKNYIKFTLRLVTCTIILTMDHSADCMIVMSDSQC